MFASQSKEGMFYFNHYLMAKLAGYVFSVTFVKVIETASVLNSSLTQEKQKKNEHFAWQ